MDLLSKLKDEDWGVIKLKYKKNKVFYFTLMFLFLILCGILYYYSIEPHPKFLNLFWSKYGFQPKYWIYIWGFIGLIVIIIKSINSKPNEELIRWCNDYLDENNLEKFSSLFKRYEKYFFSKKEDASKVYEVLLKKKEFWYMISEYNKEWLRENPERLNYSDNKETLLASQLSKLPNSPISRELTQRHLSDNTPILNTYFGNKYFIEQNYNETIECESKEYLSSLKFLKDEEKIFILKPSDNAWEQIAPKDLTIFYYIQLMNCYWQQVIKTESNGFMWPAYKHWTKLLLTQAPVMENDFNSDNLPNHYILAVDKMLSNISDWIRIIEDASNQEHIQDFNDLKIAMLLEIQKNHSNTVSETWLGEKKECLLKEIIIGKNLLQNKYNERIVNKLLQLENLEPAFEKLTDRDYYGRRKNNVGRKWLSEIINN